MSFVWTPLWKRIAACATQYGLLIVLIASVCLNVTLAQRLRGREAPAPRGVAGVSVEPARLVDAGGLARDLLDAAGRQPTLLYYFSPSCGWCERNWANVAVLERTTRGRYRFVAVSASAENEQIIARHRLEFDVYHGLPASHRRVLGLDGTPHTVVLAPDGVVLKAWPGAFNRAVRREIEAYFGVGLPGLTPRSER